MVARGKSILKDLEKDVAAINSALTANLQTHVPLIAEVGRHILLSGGKRIRPLLFILSARMCGCQGNHLSGFSTIFEYLHAATLLHDDVIDTASVRRGASTANTIWGNQAVILVGDFLLAKALSLAVTTNKLKVLQVLSQATTMMAEGEILQLLHAGNLKITEAEYFEVITRKTAILMSAACQIGAILGGVPAEPGRGPEPDGAEPGDHLPGGGRYPGLHRRRKGVGQGGLCRPAGRPGHPAPDSRPGPGLARGPGAPGSHRPGL